MPGGCSSSTLGDGAVRPAGVFAEQSFLRILHFFVDLYLQSRLSFGRFVGLYRKANWECMGSCAVRLFARGRGVTWFLRRDEVSGRTQRRCEVMCGGPDAIGCRCCSSAGRARPW